ncbi:MAG TPA: DUF1116 domain-containing protein [Terriglobales bacterium]|nr:DUF1116 domain-containing protein [Terriglobales bacterium]
MTSPVNIREEIEKANQSAVDRMMESDPFWVDIGPARKLIPGMKDKMLLHAGPPIEWTKMSGPMQGAVIGGIIYEGWANSQSEAEKLAKSGQITFIPNHHHNAVGPMAGIISPNMPVYLVQDRKYESKTYSNLNEGIGKVLRYGAFSSEVIQRLTWMRDTLAPTLTATIQEVKKSKPGVAMKPIITQALTMGDDCHNRYNAATSLFLKEITPFMMQAGLEKSTMIDSFNFMAQNNFTLLNLGMATGKAISLAAHNIKYSTIVTVLTRNGTDAAIWVSGLGNQWFVAPAPVPKGVWFPGFTEKDANPDLGDSAITETAGYGGFAMAAAPGIVSWVGGSVAYAVENTQKMYEITYTKNRNFIIPFLDFQGTPTGIDIRKVVRTGITPTINTGIAHRNAGIGQVGAGIVSFPLEIFKLALKSYAQKYGI